MDWHLLWASPLLQPAWLIALAMLIESVWRWPEKIHPLTFFRFIALRLARRVNRAEQRSIQQNRIAGVLAPALLIAPLSICLWLFLELVYFRWFFEGLILIVAIHFNPHFTRYKRIVDLAQKQQKLLGRDYLQHFVLRDVTQLSPLGIGKAAMEGNVLRFYYQVAIPLFWYFLLGPIAAISARLLYECVQVWSLKHRQYKQFGLPVAACFRWLGFVPRLYTSFVLSLFYRPWHTLPEWLRSLSSQSRDAILRITAKAISAELGGPAMYEGKKWRFQRWNQIFPTRVGHMAIMQQYIQGAKAILVVNYMLLAVLSYGLMRLA
ncbi:cobalamin biosynthesis protein CobD/CbiB [Alteromonas flava]|uniref:cobalamin biosynthesis protein CobD/CbiB n=1 Tax=Alteromonas flava TaxID=2048003 RepID=UPI000C29390E|nr:cobalamin biosynthesis protein [Alteromonas flava]